ncbi:YgjV family protein [Alteromonas sp. KUL49]|uniref:YgjV family protein n=1 Tax=Alteromonas sp. KUL49 TaxID=2480798 RepID=UPI00102F1784|nr:YgjV family protein [Alteromonas sp. KUL49]TAP34954.1 YgjV family protein [Alteromonas sp. KUL49]GEA13497.1 hypothetical protein KUL49_38720 [Alteromonas sp. KUL49]
MLILAEAFGAVAVVLNFIGYRQRHVDRYLIWSACALACVSTHFFMLGAMAAGVGTMLACIRNVVALKYRGKRVVSIFIASNLCFFAYEWFVLNHDAMILVAYASSLIFTVGSIMIRDTVLMKRWFLLAEFLGLVYALSVGSIFGTIFNISNMASIFISMYKSRKSSGE